MNLKSYKLPTNLHLAHDIELICSNIANTISVNEHSFDELIDIEIDCLLEPHEKLKEFVLDNLQIIAYNYLINYLDDKNVEIDLERFVSLISADTSKKDLIVGLEFILEENIYGN